MDDPDRIEVCVSPIHGHGVFATAPFEPGDYIAGFEGEPTTANDDHVLWVQSDSGWIGWHGTGTLRWLNHDAEPNAEFVGLELYALQRIAVGDEITIDYGPDWINQ